jgi:hypothetical protein
MRQYRRTSAEVLIDRLGDAYEKWYDMLSGYERDAISTVRQALEEINSGDRAAELASRSGE